MIHLNILQVPPYGRGERKLQRVHLNILQVTPYRRKISRLEMIHLDILQLPPTEAILEYCIILQVRKGEWKLETVHLNILQVSLNRSESGNYKGYT